MSVERPKMCRDCKLGRLSTLSAFRVPMSPLESTVIIPPRVTRECLSGFEIIKDTLTNWVEERTDIEIAEERARRKVSFSATCAKPELYSPKEENSGSLTS